ncbi:hypothetical protein V7S43_001403 [Phytophthora oleae]|uniref:Uncharacterized protein n=1 Tax=Phytophthora oleae TaxID=2107226 RepID=A0ABD3G722_9STRA
MDIDGVTDATAANALTNDDCKEPTSCPSNGDAIMAVDCSNDAIPDGPSVDDGQVGTSSSSDSVVTTSDSSSKTYCQFSDGQQPGTEMFSVTESGDGRTMSFQSPKKRVALKEKVPFKKIKKA